MFGVNITRLATKYGRMYVPEVDAVIGRSLRIYGEWAEHEIASVSRLLTDGRAIIDVGANIGTHALAFAARFPNSPVIAIEPQPLAFALLSANVLVNGYNNIDLHAVGCGERSRVIDLGMDYASLGYNLGAARIDATANGSVRPTLVTTLDNLIDDSDVQFIKIDVEGAESRVLEGAYTVLSRCKPILYLEVLTLGALQACREALAPHAYLLYWLETSAFNPSNYNGATHNIWGQTEIGVLALPAGCPLKPELTPVTGHEQHLPRSLKVDGDFWFLD